MFDDFPFSGWVCKDGYVEMSESSKNKLEKLQPIKKFRSEHIKIEKQNLYCWPDGIYLARPQVA